MLGLRARNAFNSVLVRSLPIQRIRRSIPQYTNNLRETSSMAGEELPRYFPMQVAGGKTIDIPSIGYGTWAGELGKPTTPAKPDWIGTALPLAFDIGYRQLDCAWFYGVDREVGDTIRKHGIPRDQLFITSKIWPNFYHPDAVEWCCDKILTGMGIEHVDLLLLHWPMAFEPESLEKAKHADASNRASMAEKGMKLTASGDVVIDWERSSAPIAHAGGHEGSIVPTWNALKRLVHNGKARAIGVSNFDIADLRALLPHAQDIPISVNQVEVHPWHPNNDLIEFGRKHGIITSCFSPFAGQIGTGETLIKDPTVVRVAEKNGMDMGQLLQSWAVQRGTIPLGKSGNPDRMRSNFEVRRLAETDMKALNDLEKPNKLGRTIDFTEEWGVKLWQKD